MKVQVANLRSETFEKDVIDSIINTGFVVITHHGISNDLIRTSQKTWREFFLENELLKNLFVNKKDPNMGYKAMRTETAVGAEKADLKQFYHWKPGQMIPRQLDIDTQRLFMQLNDVAGRILRVLDKDSGTFYTEQCEDSDNTILRTIHYPAMDFDSDPGAVRAAAHEDINFITLLVAASAPGLQVMDKAGNWHDVPHEENSIVVNIGDMLQLASGGKYKSTTHRVINPENNTEDRVSMPLFVHPHSHTMLAPGITAGEYLAERIAQIYRGKK